MIYPINYEQKVGFNRVREQVSERCLSAMGCEQVEKMRFVADYDTLTKLLDQTAEMTRLLREEPDSLPAQFYFDVREALKRAIVEGVYMSEDDLFDLRRSLGTINEVVWLLQGDNPFDEEASDLRYPQLRLLARDVLCFPGLVRRIDTILDAYGRIKDSASPELQRIRRELLSASGSISRKLMSILHAAQSEGLVDKDANPTMRDGRLVIPVAPALKRKIKGIVHDESATGKTVFIEPAEVVEANNRVRELEVAERHEIVRILSDFTAELRPHIPDVLGSYDFLGVVDFLRAKALTAIAMNAIRPVVEPRPVLDWVYAVHPLLQQSLQKHGKTVVPLSIELNERQRILLISGPNAGGKSVCLKTVGLLQYMMQCGLLVPMKEAGCMGIFKELFIDIGDEQSIDNDLSTYSSHLLNMKNVMRNCGPESLVLIDEFGSGTDPLIGGAIAEAVLKRINGNGAYGVITTHYHNLKQFAESNEGVVNGAMLYDRNQMQALFQLQIGQPGSSFAVEIARKIGLPEEVIADASEIVGSDYIQSDKYVQDIVRDKRYWEQKRQNIRQKEKQLEEIIAHYENERSELNANRKQIIKSAKEEAEKIIESSNAQVENTIRSIREAQAEKEQTKQAREALAAFRTELERVSASDIPVAEMPSHKRKKYKMKYTPLKEQAGDVLPVVSDLAFAIGDFVRIKGQDTVGEILELKGKTATVAAGNVRARVKLDNLEHASREEAQAQKSENQTYTYISRETQEAIVEKKLNFKQDIDVRGMRGAEAVQAVTFFIDDAVLLGVRRVRILHGTGNGILRSLIREYLRTNGAVQSFRDEHVQFGGAGITVVDLM
ncbi:MAG: Smr/MutS family protein [Bacteroidaceae bacterium]|nr:Smr/MutS family protein [Bacteroidaceae bacterium]